MPLTGSITGSFKNLNELYRKFDSSSSLSASYINSALTSLKDAQTKTNYSNFKEHVFFDSAVRKLDAALYKIVTKYPIGISGNSAATLTDYDLSNSLKFQTEATPFENYVLNYLGGVTGGDITLNPTITAGVTSAGNYYSVIVVYRYPNNTLSGNQSTLSSSLYDIATKFDNDSFNKVYNNLSFTASDDFTYSNSGYEFSNNVNLPSVLEKINTDSQLRKLVPESYFWGDEEDVLERYLAVMGRSFDDIKLKIDELSNLTKITYDNYHKTPDGVFQTMLAKQYGIDLIETGFGQSIEKYLRSSNNKLAAKQVTYEIYDRLLNNLVSILKYKGTKEALESIVRIFGLPTNYLSFNDYKFFQKQKTRTRIDYVNTKVLNMPANGAISFTGSSSAGMAFTQSASARGTIEARVTLTGGYDQPGASTGNVIASFGNGLMSAGYALTYKNGQFNFIFDTGVAQTPVSLSSLIINTISSNWINVFGVLSSNSAYVKAMWMTTSSGSAVINSISSPIVSGQTGGTIQGSGLTGTIGASGGNNSFVGYIQEVKGFNTILSDDDMIEHVKNFESTSYFNSTFQPVSGLRFYYKLKENKVLTGTSNYILDSSGNSYTGYAIGILTSSQNFYVTNQLIRKETNYTSFGNFIDDNTEFTIDDTSKNEINNISNRTISISFNPIEAVNNDIINVFGNFNMSNLISDPRNFIESGSSFKNYPILEASGATVFRRYNGQKLKFNNYIKAIDNFSYVVAGIVHLVNQFIPARSRLISRGVVLDNHILDRPRNRQVDINNSSDYPTKTLTSLPFSSQASYDTYEVGVYSINSPLTTSTNLTNAQLLKGKDAIVDSYLYYNLSGTRDILISNTAVAHTKNETIIVSNNSIIYPYYQEVDNPKDTSILITTNRNILETSSTLSSNTLRSTITGNIKLLRQSNGKIIKSQQNTVRLDIPRYSSTSNMLAITAGSIPITSNSYNLIINNKDGIDIIIKSSLNNASLGIQNLKITNLLSGASQDYPFIILPTSSDTQSLGGGQTIVRIGKAQI